MPSSDSVIQESAVAERSAGSSEIFLTTLFEALDSNNIRYCVLHSWEELPGKLPSDLDIAVHPEDESKLRFAFALLREKGYTPVQVFNYFVHAYYFIFAWFEGPAIRAVAVDVIFEHRRGGLIAPSGEQLVAGRRRCGIFWIPAPEPEFVYLLAKKTWKGAAPERQTYRLKALVEQLGRAKAESLASELFLGNLGKQVVEACAGERLNGLLAQLKTQTWKASLIRSPFGLARYLAADAWRRVRRWLQPTGLFVVIMGPDGVGKSTLINRLVEEAAPLFRRYRVFHWRPTLLWRRNSTGDTTQPHSRPPHRRARSMARIVAHLLDYWFGYGLVIRPFLARSGLVVFDRYFNDVLIDPKRYRYGGPLWLARFCRRFVPEPDLQLILDAPEHVILSRKREVAPDELRRQRSQYLQAANEGPGSRVIDASAPVSGVTAECAKVIIERLSQRFERSQGRWHGQALGIADAR